MLCFKQHLFLIMLIAFCNNSAEVWAMTGKHVLMVLPSQAYLRLEGGVQWRVGSYLDEVVVPSLALVRAGYNITCVSVEGNKPPLDPSSNQSSYFANVSVYKEALLFWEAYPALQHPILLTSISAEDPLAPVDAIAKEYLSQFDAVFIPGGHSPIIDLWPSTALGRILAYFIDHEKIIAAICHGPLTLASVHLVRQPWDFAGKNMTVFSTEEEKFVEKHIWKRKLGFYPQEVLHNLGGKMQELAGFGSHVVVDGKLVTGQNPASAIAFGEAFVKLLESSP